MLFRECTLVKLADAPVLLTPAIFQIQTVATWPTVLDRQHPTGFAVMFHEIHQLAQGISLPLTVVTADEARLCADRLADMRDPESAIWAVMREQRRKEKEPSSPSQDPNQNETPAKAGRT